jgi:hypothetical protein
MVALTAPTIEMTRNIPRRIDIALFKQTPSKIAQ